MKHKIYSHSANFKRILVFFAVILISSLLWYTQNIVNNLREDSSELINFYAETYLDAIQSYEGEDFGFVFDKIIKKISLPMIWSEEKDRGVSGWKNIGIDNENTTLSDTLKIEKMMKKMDDANEPIHLKYEESSLGYIHYGDTILISKLRMLPFIEIGVVALFIFLGYIGFQQIRSSERSSIWAGMAKETAHQLGTPLSSIMGWTEVLKTQYENDENLDEMSKDIKRLERVTNRFSKIGSIPKLFPGPITNVIQESVDYYSRRIPQFGGKVQLNFKCDETYHIDHNPDLFSWAMENLIKNAIDAIADKEGKVNISIFNQEDKKLLIIDVKDTGKGIEKKNWQNVFRPGFSTKRRGWGLGLSLTKRIVEDYHNGKLFVYKSKPGQGTIMRISLKN